MVASVLELSLHSQGWGVSENLHNQIFLLSVHFHFLSTSIIFSFITFCPLLSLSLSLPISLAAAVADWVLCPFFSFLLLFDKYCILLFVSLHWQHYLERTLYGQLLSPVQSFFDLNCINVICINSSSQILGKDCHLLCACAIVL